MATLEQQHELGELMRQTDDAHYRLYLALFTFHAMANYFNEIPEGRFAEVEKTLAEVEDTLVKVRAAMAKYMRARGHLACHFSDVSDMSCYENDPVACHSERSEESLATNGPLWPSRDSSLRSE